MVYISYRLCVAESYLRHPNSYLPRYNIQSETDGESAPLTGKKPLNGLDIGPHQIIESDEEDVPSYGFPSQQIRRNRREPSDIDLALSNGGKFRFYRMIFIIKFNIILLLLTIRDVKVKIIHFSVATTVITVHPIVMYQCIYVK